MNNELASNTSSKLNVRRLAQVAVPVALVAGSLAVDALTARPVNGDSACDPKSNNHEYGVVVRRVPFYNIGGRDHIFDYAIDPFFELPVTGGEMRALDRKSGKVLAATPFQLDKPGLTLFKPKPGETEVAYSVLQWTGDCDTTTSGKTPSGKTLPIAGKQIHLVDSQDEANKYDLTVATKGVVNHMGGKEIKDAETFLKTYAMNPEKLRAVDPEKVVKAVKEAFAREQAEKAAKATAVVPTAVPSATSKPQPSVTAVSTATAPAKVETRTPVASGSGSAPVLNVGTPDTFRTIAPWALGGLGLGAVLGVVGGFFLGRGNRNGIIAERDAAVTERDEAIDQRDEAFETLDETITEVKQAHTDLGVANTDRDNAIAVRDLVADTAVDLQAERELALDQRDNALTELTMAEGALDAALDARDQNWELAADAIDVSDEQARILAGIDHQVTTLEAEVGAGRPKRNDLRSIVTAMRALLP